MREFRVSLLLGSSLPGLLGKEVVGLANTSFEQIVVLHNQLDIINGEIDEHARDLGSLLSNQLIDELVKYSTDLVLVIRVLRDNGWENLVGGHDVSLVDGQLLLLYLLRLPNLFLLLLNCNHLLLGGRLLLRHSHLVLHSHLLMGHARSTHHAILLLVLSVLVSLSLVSTSICARTTWSFPLSAHIWRALLSHSGPTSLLLHQEWHALDEKLEVVLEFFLVSKVGPLSTL